MRFSIAAQAWGYVIMIGSNWPRALAVGAATLLAATASSGGAQAQARRAPVDGPHIGRCHMGECSWYDITRVTTVRQTPAGRLVHVLMREGGSSHGRGRYPTSARSARIEWQEVDGGSYYFCSTRHPVAMSENTGEWTATPLNVITPGGTTEFITSVYTHVCHPGVNMTQARARRLGYRDEYGEEFTLPSRDDIFNHR